MCTLFFNTIEYYEHFNELNYYITWGEILADLSDLVKIVKLGLSEKSLKQY